MIRARAAAGLAIALAATGCRSCDPPGAAKPETADARALGSGHVVAELDAKVTALAASRDALFALRGDDIVSVALTGEGEVRVLAASERSPFALVARAGAPVWASREGIFVCDADGHGRRQLVADPALRSLAAGPHGIAYANRDALFRMEWPQAPEPRRLADGVAADEVALTPETVVWLDRGAGEAWSFDLKSGARRRLAAGERAPRDLSIANDDRTALWHEAAPDHPRAFTADTVSGQVRELAGMYAGDARYLLRSGCLFGAGECKPAALVDWTALASAGRSEGESPVADDLANVYWMEASPAIGGGRSSFRIVSAAKADCCH